MSTHIITPQHRLFVDSLRRCDLWPRLSSSFVVDTVQVSTHPTGDASFSFIGHAASSRIPFSPMPVSGRHGDFIFQYKHDSLFFYYFNDRVLSFQMILEPRLHRTDWLGVCTCEALIFADIFSSLSSEIEELREFLDSSTDDFCPGATSGIKDFSDRYESCEMRFGRDHLPITAHVPANCKIDKLRTFNKGRYFVLHMQHTFQHVKNVTGLLKVFERLCDRLNIMATDNSESSFWHELDWWQVQTH